MKKTFIFLFVAFVLGFVNNSVAQNTKIGYFDFAYVLPQLPAYKAAQSDLQVYAKKLEEDYQSKDVEFKGKYEKYMKYLQENQDKLDQNDPILLSMQKELQNLQQQMQDFQVNAEQSVQKKENALLEPILQQVEKAIQDVAKENSYTFIVKKEALLYAPLDNSADISNLVLKKMGVTPAQK